MASSSASSALVVSALNKQLTIEVKEKLDTWEKVLTWTKLAEGIWKNIATHLGDETLTDELTIATIPDSDFREAAKELDIKGIPKTRLNLAINVVRTRMGNEVSDIFAEAPIPVLPVQQSQPGNVLSLTQQQTSTIDHCPGGITRNTIKVREIFNQACRIEMLPLDEPQIKVMRKRWVDLHETDPPEENNPTDAQLTVAYRLNAMGHNMLNFDMAVWGPHGDKRERDFAMAAHYQNADGAYITREIPGPRTLEDWITIWEFATVVFVMTGVVSEGVATSYMKFFTRLARNYPQSWWLAQKAEAKLRSSWALAEKRRQEDFFETNPDLSKYDPTRPWGTVLLASIKGVDSIDYWENNFKEPARKWEREGGQKRIASWADRLEDDPLSGPASSSNVGQVQNPPGQGRRALKRQAAVARDAGRTQAPPPPQRHSEVAQRPNWADTQRPDGRYLYDVGGTEICFKYSRNANGCTTACEARPARAHCCEWCRGPHRSIHCTVHPNWVPDQEPREAKGAGKGKGKKGKYGK